MSFDKCFIIVVPYGVIFLAFGAVIYVVKGDLECLFKNQHGKSREFRSVKDEKVDFSILVIYN